MSVISKTPHPEVNAASLESDCFPEPPTPTRSALPWSRRTILCMRVRCSSASSKNTRFIGLFSALYKPRSSSNTGLTSAYDARSSYGRSAGGFSVPSSVRPTSFEACL